MTYGAYLPGWIPIHHPSMQLNPTSYLHGAFYAVPNGWQIQTSVPNRRAVVLYLIPQIDESLVIQYTGSLNVTALA